MVIVSRRKLLGVGLVAGFGLTCPVLARASVPLPKGDWTLSRSIERQLGDGNFVIVNRRWNVQFVAEGTGSHVVGRQTDVSVTAPERLQQLAKLEEDRATNDMFPIELTALGLIHSAGPLNQAEAIDKAALMAIAILDKSGAGAASKGAARQFLAQLQSSASPVLETLPPDLFRPSGEKTETVRAVKLPDGSNGEFRLEYWGQSQASSPWLDQAQRIITTRIGDSSRLSRETWMLKPA
ncbi:MAG: hypothetical protein ABJ239_05225 [Erythrobacter sp.]